MTGQRSAGASVPSLLLSTEKVTASHRSRDAYVYVRQSTPSQMIHHTESLARQYELRERAVMLGWPAHQVVVIDADPGRSGAQTAGRTGFKELVADVGLGKVGVVLGIEVSRLARNNADWYQLLDLCAITDTLIADADGVYHPADFNDRLVLGLKGTMSEAELHLIRSRLTAGLKHKAAKGELRQGLPVGLDYDEDDKVVLCADESVREAITTVFRRFEELGSARQVLIRLREDGVLLPRRRNGAKRIFWAQATYPAVHDLLTNPAYAGAFVFGRTRTEKRVDPESGTVHARDRLVPREQWEVLIPDHHRGFITWETFEANTARLRSNWRRPRELAGGAVREGRALLQGLLRCGRCGRIMQTAYSGTKGNCPRYVCARAKQLYAGEHVCQSIGGVRLENTVPDELFTVLEPAALSATAQALAEADAHHRRDLAVFELGVERARYEADRAQRQFDNVEPENRLVARTLESTLEAKLVAVRAAENNLAAQRARRPVALTKQELAWITTAGADVRAVFEAPTTTLRERKQLIRAVIDEIAITVRAEERVAQLRILWQGGAGTEVSMPMTKPGQHLRVTDEATVAWCAAWPSTTTTAPSRRSWPSRNAAPPPTYPSPERGWRSCAPATTSPSTSRRYPMSAPTATMSSWSPSPPPNRSSASPGAPCTAGSATDSSPPSRSPPARLGASASTRPCVIGSDPRYPTAGSVSTRPPRHWALPDKPCCTRSNAANWRPSTSTADVAKGSVSRSNPTSMDYSTYPDRRRAQC